MKNNRGSSEGAIPFNNLKSIAGVPLWQALGLVEEGIWVWAPELASFRI